MQETDIRQVAAKIRQLKRNDGSTVLFLGAGASKSAGIPLADEIVLEIENNDDFKEFFEDHPQRTYPIYMNRLSSNDRKRLFNAYIDKAQINSAHLYAGLLVAEKYVDLIVTTNFDPLMLKCLTLFYGIIPYVYDLAMAKGTVTANYQTPAIIYLHGQSHGFWQLNTKDELDAPKELIRDMFSKISRNRTIVIVGYSGNDPVLNHLARVGNFGENLYWIGYEDKEPNDNVKENLLNNLTNGSYLVKGYNADSFFLALKNQLKLNEPAIYSKPFSFLLDNLRIIKPIQKDDKDHDMFDITRKQIREAIKGFEEKKGFADNKEVSRDKISGEDLLRRIKEIYSSDNFNELTAIQNELQQTTDNEIKKYYAYTYNSWGIMLYARVQNEEGQKAVQSLEDSIDKYKRAIEIKEDFSEAYYNWGIALYSLASQKEDEDAVILLNDSIKKYQRVIEIRNDDYEAYNSWGLALSGLANKGKGKEVERFLNESIEKYKMATVIKNDYFIAYNNWGIALCDLANKKEDKEAERLLNESIEKYMKVFEIKEDFPEAYYNCGSVLYNLANLKEDEETEKLLNESINKFSKAIELKKDYLEVYIGWASTLLRLANKKEGAEAKTLLLLSIEKSRKAEDINKGTGAYNLACAYSLLNDVENAILWFSEALKFSKISRTHIEKDSDINNIRNDPRYKELLDKYRPVM